MVEYQFFYRKDNQQIDAVYRDCISGSTKYVEGPTYKEVNVTDPPYTLSRDHKVVLDAEDNVIDTTPSINPVQPVDTVELPMNPAYGEMLDIDLTKAKPLQLRIVYKGTNFDYWCFVTQDLVDLYNGGNLNVGDIVTMIFCHGEETYPLAQQKVKKTW